MEPLWMAVLMGLVLLAFKALSRIENWPGPKAKRPEGRTPAGLEDCPYYPIKIQLMIVDTKVPLIELVLAVEAWVEGKPIGPNPGSYPTEVVELSKQAVCHGCGATPSSVFRTGKGNLYCRTCWDEYVALKRGNKRA